MEEYNELNGHVAEKRPTPETRRGLVSQLLQYAIAKYEVDQRKIRYLQEKCLYA